MDGVRICFELHPLSDVQPWGDAESGRRLHWFGLTDGWYDVVTGEHRLYSVLGETRGIDYQVVRLWEDLIEVAPLVLESVPEPLASRLANFDAWTAWVEKTWDLDDRDVVSTRDGTGLVVQPRDVGRAPRASAVATDVALWRRATHALEVSAARIGNARLVVAEWQSNDERKCIPRRVDQVRSRADHCDGDPSSEIERNWSRPDIAIDVEELRREHADRSTLLQRAFQGPRYRQPSWDAIVEAVVALEHRIGGP